MTTSNERKGERMSKVSPAVKTETIRISVGCTAATVLMCLIFLILHQIWPEQVPFDWTVILGGAGGCGVAIANFFLMGLAVQKVAAETDEKRARQRMAVSQQRRTLLMLLWGIAALTAPCFNGAAGIIPLLFPSAVIKIWYLTFGKAGGQTPAQKTVSDSVSDNVTEKGSE